MGDVMLRVILVAVTTSGYTYLFSTVSQRKLTSTYFPNN